ncbi:MAG: hypothetical protein FWC45_02280 [Treponema sp.]|nr:hypothetical protein [Treponema sp.]
MTKSVDIEDEIDAIRDRIYKTTEKMTPQERAEYINSRAKKTLKKLKSSKPVAVEAKVTGYYAKNT